MNKTVFIIGAGAVGRSLATALLQRQVQVTGIFDKYNSKVFEVASSLGVGAYYSEELPDVVARADVVLLAVPESEVASLAREAVASGHAKAGQVWLQTAGSLSAGSLSALASSVAGLGTLHPAMVFPPFETTVIPPDTTFTFDGDANAKNLAQALVKILDGRLCEIGGEARGLYHAALVMGSNYQVALLLAAKEILRESGLKDQDAEQLLIGLTQSAVDNVAKYGLHDGLSGPIRRGDNATVEKHLSALSPMNDQKQLYASLGLVLQKVLSDNKTISNESGERIKDLLDKALTGAGQPQDD